MASTKNALSSMGDTILHHKFVSHVLMLGLVAFVFQVPTLAQTTVAAKTLRAVKGVRQTLATSTGAVAFVNVPGAVATFSVPGNTADVFIARFTAESVCSGVSGWCPVRILLNGAEMDPVVGTDFAFDSTEGGTASSLSWESHAVDRSRLVTNSSTAALNVTIQVQYAVTAVGITLRLDDWHLTVEQYH